MATAISAEDELQYWLATEDWYMSRHTRDWLDRTAPDEARETLTRLAEHAAPEPRALWYRALSTFAAGFSPSGNIADPKMGERKAGLRAALMLADLSDVRAVAPLVRVWETDPARQGKYQERMETALLHLVSNLDGEQARLVAPELRDLAARVWETGGDYRDLSPTLADLFSATVRVLRASGTDENQAALAAFSEANASRFSDLPAARKSQPNRTGVWEVLHNL